MPRFFLIALAASALLLAGCATTSPSAPPPAPPPVTTTLPAVKMPDAAARPPVPPPPSPLPAAMQSFAQDVAARDGFDPAALQALLARAVYVPRVIAIMDRPGESRPWYAYRDQLINNHVVNNGHRFMTAEQAALTRAQAVYGVPAEIIAAILGIETRFGENTGSFRVIDSLSTLGFYYPRRAGYFRNELEQYLLLTRTEHLDPLAMRGSFAGAVGWPQFMPSTWRRMAVDFDGDGHCDLVHDPVDAIGSVANYLHQAGWLSGGTVALPARVRGHRFRRLLAEGITPRHDRAQLAALGVRAIGRFPPDARAALFQLDGRTGPEYWLGFHNFEVITRYNHSRLYAMAVWQLAEALAGS